MIIKKDFEIVKAKRERTSLALKAKKESSDEESSTSGSEDEEYAMAVRDFKKFFKRRGRCGDLNHLIGECPKPQKDKNQRAFIEGSWSDSGEEDDKKAKDETCLIAQVLNEECFNSSYFSDENSSTDDFTLDNKYDKLCKMNQKPSGDKLGLGFNSFEVETSGSKEIKFVKSQKETSSGGGPLIIKSGPTFSIKGPPIYSFNVEKSVSF
ncbi:hypothetical protein Tco_0757766 [Tanacetum coccineum]